jgi:hypothetical protein
MPSHPILHDERASVRSRLVPGMVTAAKPVDQGPAVSARFYDFHDECLRCVGRKKRRDELRNRLPHSDSSPCQVTLKNAEPGDLHEPIIVSE